MRAIPLAALLWLVTSPAASQTAGDSAASFSADRYVIDAAKLVRENGARSFSDLLVGQVPGLLVIPGWGLNGSGARIRFAGVRSLVDDPPLILVDGMRVDAEENATLFFLDGPGPLRLEDLSVEDVESIEVLRGPASGAVYGPGAANGVILIHTKAGRSGPPRWETYAQGGFESGQSNWPANYGGVDVDNVNPRMRTGGCHLTEQAAGQCVQDFVQSSNPLVQHSPFETVLRHQVGFSGSGGPSWGTFRLAGAFDGDAGPYAIPGVSPAVDNFKRWNLRGTGAIHPFSGFDLGIGVARMSSDLRLPTYAPIQAALLGPSDDSQFEWDSVFHYPGGQQLDRTSWSIDARGTLLPWLTVRGELGRDDVDQREGLVDPTQFRFDGLQHVVHNRRALSASVRSPIGPRVRLEATIGYERFGRRLEVTETYGRDTTPFCVPPSPCSMGFSLMERRTEGLYVTEELVVRDRLSITGALRHDYFDEYRLSVTHPSIAVAWLARAGTVGPVSRLQLRAAYGSAGSPPPDVVAFVVVPPPAPSRPPFRPDRTRSFELGADAGLLSGKWAAGLTYYDMHSDVGTLQTIASSSGVFTIYLGGNKIRNQGVAATLSGRVLDRSTLAWDVRLSVWGNRNRVIALSGAPSFNGFQTFAPGLPPGSYLAPRIRSYADANGDGIIVPSEVVIDTLSGWAGTPNPTQGAAVSSALRFGRWRVATTLEYRAGQTLINGLEWLRCGNLGTCRGRNDPTASLEAQAVASAATRAVTVDYFEDADYLKVRDLSVSFDVPAGAASLLRARGATITLVGRNLLTLTGYSGVDPEAGSYPLSIAGLPPSVADLGTLPPLRSWTLRVQLAY